MDLVDNTAWLGFTDSAEEGTFVWSDGSPSNDYANWAAGEPNEWGGETHNVIRLAIEGQPTACMPRRMRLNQL